MARSNVMVQPRVLMAWAIANVPGATLDSLVDDEKAYQAALEAYHAAHETQEEKTTGAPSERLVVASVAGMPIAAYRFVAQRGRSTLKVEIEEQLQSDARVRKASIALDCDVEVDDLTEEVVSYLQRFGSPEWQDFLAQKHPLKVKAPTENK